MIKDKMKEHANKQPNHKEHTSEAEHYQNVEQNNKLFGQLKVRKARNTSGETERQRQRNKEAKS